MGVQKFLTDDGPAIIAEIGGNPGGHLSLARKMIDSAAKSGARYVKFQTYIADRLLSPKDPGYEDFKGESFSFDQFREIARYCSEKGVVFLSTPFDPSCVDFLDEAGVPAFKVASCDITHLPLLEYIGRKQKPILLATGASTWADIDAAVDAIHRVSDAELVLLHCIAAYPAPDEEANLRVLSELKSRYGCPIGFSDHTLGVEIALGAIALGAQVVEKHFTTNRELPGGDNAISILPDELARLIEGGQRIWTALGNSERTLTETEKGLQPLIRRSLVSVRDLVPGYQIKEEDLRAIRPGTGIPPGDFVDVVGRIVQRSVLAYQPIQWDNLT